MRLAEISYRHTKGFPKHELFGLTAQIRRAAASIPANIAEGYGRDNRGSYVQFLRIAQGSCKELETHVLLASRVLGDMGSGPEPVLDQADVVGKMLRGLIRSLQFSPADFQQSGAGFGSRMTPDCRRPTAESPLKPG